MGLLLMFSKGGCSSPTKMRSSLEEEERARSITSVQASGFPVCLRTGFQTLHFFVAGCHQVLEVTNQHLLCCILLSKGPFSDPTWKDTVVERSTVGQGPTDVLATSLVNYSMRFRFQVALCLWEVKNECGMCRGGCHKSQSNCVSLASFRRWIFLEHSGVC